MRSNYKRWINSKEPGQTSFVTTTCLDFAHLFARPEMKSRVAINIFSECLRHEAKIRAFVVMSNHVHLIAVPPETKTISFLVQQIKRSSAHCLGPLLHDTEQQQLSMQQGLNHHQFWQKSFRGNPLVSESIILQKIAYINANPVRAGLVEHPDDYLWSSGHLSLKDLCSYDGIMLEKAIRYYEALLD